MSTFGETKNRDSLRGTQGRLSLREFFMSGVKDAPLFDGFTQNDNATFCHNKPFCHPEPASIASRVEGPTRSDSEGFTCAEVP
jgi:hypothetical protein